MAAFFAMDGYALYVWGSYLLTAAVMAWLFLGARRGLRRRERQLAELRARAPHRRARQQEAQQGGQA